MDIPVIHRETNGNIDELIKILTEAKSQGINFYKLVEDVEEPSKLVQVCHHCGGSGEEPYSQPNQSKIKLIQAATTLSEYINQLDKDTFTCGDLFKIKLAQHVVESYKL